MLAVHSISSLSVSTAFGICVGGCGCRFLVCPHCMCEWGHIWLFAMHHLHIESILVAGMDKGPHTQLKVKGVPSL